MVNMATNMPSENGNNSNNPPNIQFGFGGGMPGFGPFGGMGFGGTSTQGGVQFFGGSAGGGSGMYFA